MVSSFKSHVTNGENIWICTYFYYMYVSRVHHLLPQNKRFQNMSGYGIIRCIHVGPHFGTGPVTELGLILIPVTALGHSCPQISTVQLGLHLGLGLDSQFLNGLPCSRTRHPKLAPCQFGDVSVPVPELGPKSIPVLELGQCQNGAQHIDMNKSSQYKTGSMIAWIIVINNTGSRWHVLMYWTCLSCHQFYDHDLSQNI